MDKNLKIKRENTAIVKGISKSCKLLIEDYKEGEKVFDFGAGKLRNTKNMLNAGIPEISITDIPPQLERIEKKLEAEPLPVNVYYKEDLAGISGGFDRAICSFVINVIENPEERVELLNNIYNLLKTGGEAYIEVRSYQSEIDCCKHKEEYNDGFILKRKGFYTFNKAFNKWEFLGLVSYPPFKLKKFMKGRGSLIAILVKE